MIRKRTLQLRTYKDKRGKFRARMFAGNGKQLARSPKGYEENLYVDGLEAMLYAQHDADLYRDKRGQWRWRFALPDHGIIMVSSESYKNKRDCKVASDLVLDSIIVEQ